MTRTLITGLAALGGFLIALGSVVATLRVVRRRHALDAGAPSSTTRATAPLTDAGRTTLHRQATEPPYFAGV